MRGFISADSINYKLKRWIFQFSNRFVSRWLVFSIDIIISAIAFLSAVLIRFNFETTTISARVLTYELMYVLGIQVFFFFVFRSFNGVIRHTSLADTLKIFKAVTVASLVLVTSNFLQRNGFVPQLSYVHISVIIIYYHINLFALIISRLMFKAFYHYLITAAGKYKRNVMIYGAGELGIITKNTLQGKNYRVVGFVDDNRSKIGKVIEGVEVYPMDEDFDDLLKKKNVQEIIISIQNINFAYKRDIIDKCLNYDVLIKDVPTIDKWINGELSLNQIKNINIEDLLGRESIKIDNINIKSELRGKCVLITGAAGSIGRELVTQCLYYKPSRLIMVDQSETGLYEAEIEINNLHKTRASVAEVIVADITNKKRMELIFDQYKPDIVFHAAAYKHVPMMENNPFEAVLCNINGTRILADLSVKYRVKKFVMVSTDKAVNPTNIMGASKRIAEIYVQSLDIYLKKIEADSTKFITTRFGNVLGSNGSVIPLFKKQIANGGPITVTHPEITRYFMTISEACSLVLEAGAMGNGGEIYVFDMGKSIKIIDLARKMVQLSGLRLDKDIQIIYTGLREGEKLYEELLNSKEDTSPTHHPKIMIGQVRTFEHTQVKPQIESLIEKATSSDDMELVSMMKKIVPEYISQASKYEELDEINRVNVQ
jgi:FlaA1/EpsC-like NDP-sugar epimerase